MEDLRVIGRGSKNRWMVWNPNSHLHNITLSVKSAKQPSRGWPAHPLWRFCWPSDVWGLSQKNQPSHPVGHFLVLGRNTESRNDDHPRTSRRSRTNYPLTPLWGPKARTDTPNIQHRRRQVTHLDAYYSKYHYTPTRREHAIRIKSSIVYLDCHIRTVQVNWLINWWG